MVMHEKPCLIPNLKFDNLLLMQIANGLDTVCRCQKEENRVSLKI